MDVLHKQISDLIDDWNNKFGDIYGQINKYNLEAICKMYQDKMEEVLVNYDYILEKRKDLIPVELLLRAFNMAGINISVGANRINLIYDLPIFLKNNFDHKWESDGYFTSSPFIKIIDGY